MISKAFESEILKNLELLTIEQQNKALAYLKSLLKNRNNGEHQQELLQFAGSLDPTALREISETIDAGCEEIDKNGW